MVLPDAELPPSRELAVEHDLLVITDEVYEQLVFDGRRHLPLAGYPGMAERTITISSAAKMFNVHRLEDRMGLRRQPISSPGCAPPSSILTYVGGAPFQPAVAQALDTEDAWVGALRESLQGKRDRLSAALTDIGFDVHDSFGTYFLCADPRPLGYADSTAFCAELPERAGVAAIPMSAFCDPRLRAHRRLESPGALRLLQARRHHGRGDPPAAGAEELVVVLWAVDIDVDGAQFCGGERLPAECGARQLRGHREPCIPTAVRRGSRSSG